MRNIILAPIVLGTLTFTPDQAAADCVPSTTDTTVVECTGDNASISYTDGSVLDIEIDSLTSDVTGDTAVELSQTVADTATDGDSGVAADALTLSASMDSYSISGTTIAVDIASQGGGGAEGEESKTKSNATGGDGGDGGGGGDVTVTVTGSSGSAIASDSVGVFLQSFAGAGGTGGEGFVADGSGISTATGGTGGVGGAGGTVSLEFTDTAAATISSGEGPLFDLLSEGGDGGTGGLAKVNNSEDFTVNRGEGGAGGDGGDVTLTADVAQSTLITTTENYNHGAVIQSAGGDGGDMGSDSTSGNSGDTKNRVNQAGGAGGAGGDVTVSLDASMQVSGDYSQGLMVRSIGGAGGTSGDTTLYGAGGIGGDVTVTFSGTITTDGQESNAILAQSIAGYTEGTDTTDTFVAYGTGDTSEAYSGTVDVTIADGSTISTSSDYSAGIDAHSVGGGGGKGSTDGATLTRLGSDSSTVGGDGGSVNLTIGAASITTSATGSQAISAVSVGGTGGKGGSQSALTAIGSSSGTGGDGGDVNIGLIGATVSTGAGYSTAIYGSSVGGGGGDGYSTSASIGRIGTNGGDGGYGGNVTLLGEVGSGQISTTFELSDAIHLQSIGGGGGSGGNSSTDTTELSLNIGGGSGGAGGTGGDINVVFEGNSSNATPTASSDSSAYDIFTLGDHSRGVLLQTVGGGGGNAGNSLSISESILIDVSVGGGTTSTGGSGADGGTIKANFGSSIYTSGELSSGLIAQSVGGSGGNGGTTVTITASALSISDDHAHTIGSSGGKGGDGGEVDVTTSNTITTTGFHSTGITAQSIGGGGGTGGAVYSTEATLSVDITWGSANGLTTNVGSGGEGGDSANVTVTTGGTTNTGGDFSTAITAQSIAGGGGNGGTMVDVSTLDISALNQYVGSTGGAGGSAGDVEVTSNADIYTEGYLSHGVLAQSIGGTGGNGGTVVDVSALSASVNMAVGGDGSGGGTAGTVTVYNYADITTAGAYINGTAILNDGSVDELTGENSAAIVAQSIGGSGGSGGSVYSGDLSAFAVASWDVGGTGGAGGTGGQVYVYNEPDTELQTAGSYAYGILAQSIGGNGGSGGSVISAEASAGEISVDASIVIGGAGASGGSADLVYIENDGTITTSGFGATLIAAQSIGGAGGNGGNVLSGTASISSDATIDLGMTVGGDGGSPGSGGAVTIENTGGLTGEGHFSNGILAQSISGSGGNGGNSVALYASVSEENTATVAYTAGGSGGSASDTTAGDVKVTNSGTIEMSGGESSAIYAQSIGGDGGKGGSAVALFYEFSASSGSSSSSSNEVSANLSWTAGGDGGGGGDAGGVTVINSGTITTTESISRGIYAQSVGGGGGDAGSASSATVSLSQEEAEKEEEENTTTEYELDLSVEVGGDGGKGGAGGEVNVTNESSITTQGIASYAIMAQSVGGSGGNGGDGDITEATGWVSDLAKVTDDIEQAQDFWNAVSDWSSFFSSYDISVAGSGGSGDTGGTVVVSNSDALVTTGISATAIFAQSVGGGGGSGGDASQALALDVTVEGNGADGGNGGTVTVTNTGTINTSGAGAMGIFAQSVGGGGGAAGDIEYAFGASIVDLNLNSGAAVFGDKTGGDGTGGAITVETGDITTTGDFAHAIFAQSIGGSGGATGTSSYDSDTDTYTYSGTLGSIGGSDGTGDSSLVKVTVDSGSTVSVSGDYAVGIIAQSVAGDSSTSGDVELDISGTVEADGTDGRAIFAQSEGGSTNGEISVKILEGATVSSSEGSDGYDTVTLLDGDGNLIEIAGTLENTSDDTSSNVIYAAGDTSGSTVQIDDTGILTGSLEMDGDGTSVATVTNAGTFNLGTTIDLGGGSGSSFSNSGTISPGGSGVVSTTALTVYDGFTNEDDGIILADWSYDSSSETISGDLITVTSANSAVSIDLGSGTVTPQVTEDSDALPSDGGTYFFYLLGYTDGADVDYEDASVTDTSTVDYSLEQITTTSDGDYIQVNMTVDYSASDDLLSDISRDYSKFFVEALGLYQSGDLDDTDLGDSLDQMAIDVLNIRTAEALDAYYKAHAPEEAAYASLAGIQDSHSMQDLLQSCPVITPGLPNFMRQSDCSWLKFRGSHFDYGSTSSAAGLDLTTYGLSAGMQREVSDHLFVEGAINYSDVSGSGDAIDQNGYTASIGAAIKREIDSLTLSGTINGGYFSYDNTRFFMVSGTPHSATGSPDGYYFGGELRAAWTLTKGPSYIKPSLGLSANHIEQNAHTESGSNPLVWNVGALSETRYAFRPAIELGHSFAGRNGLYNSLYLKTIGTVFLGDNDFKLASTYAGAEKLGTHTSVVSGDDAWISLEAGVNLQFTERSMLTFEGRADFSENSSGYGGEAQLRLNF